MISAKMLSGSKSALLYRLGAVEHKTIDNVGRAIEAEAINLVRVVKKKLSDDVLHVRTGRLRRSITYRMDQADGGNFVAKVGTVVRYARAHEYGFNGSVNVPAHLVKEHYRMQSQAFGKPMANPRRVLVRSFTMSAHAMRMNVPARPFLRPALEENRGRILNNLRTALEQALNV